MKKSVFFALFLMCMLKLSGQSHGITYQAVIINADAQEIPGVDINGNYMPEQPLVVRFTIQDETEIIEYQEELHTDVIIRNLPNVTIKIHYPRKWDYSVCFPE